MRLIISLILGAVFACQMIYSLMTGRLPRKVWARNRDGELEWTPVYRSDFPRWYRTGVIFQGLAAGLCLVFAFVPWTVVKSAEKWVPEVFRWGMFLASVSAVYQIISALVSGKVSGRARFPTMGSDPWNSCTYRSDEPIAFWIIVMFYGFAAIIAALAWWFVPRT